MRQQVERHIGFFKTTAIGGVVFLLPLIVVGALLGQVGYLAWQAAEAINPYLPFHETAGLIGLFAATVAGLVALCFFCGMLARRSLGRWFTGQAERYLAMLFPRYAVFKDQLTGNLGTGSLRPVVAKIGPWTRIAVEVERDDAAGVTVYLPSSPDPWTGTIAVVPPEAVTPIEGDFGDVMATFEKLGRGTGRYVGAALKS